jgi:hypothetical protein
METCLLVSSVNLALEASENRRKEATRAINSRRHNHLIVKLVLSESERVALDVASEANL